MLTELLNVCHAALGRCRRVTTSDVYDGDRFEVTPVGGNKYTVKIDEADVEPDEGVGVSLPDLRTRAVPAVKNHVDILDVCLHALKASDYAKHLEGVTTDGDHRDCEAIFYTEDDGWLSLKVR